MRAVNIREAKAHLNQLIDAAVGGEQVVLMRGSRHVAALVPITADDLELSTLFTDLQARRLWDTLAAERVATFASAAAAVDHLRAAPGQRKRAARPKKAAR
jgi:antitoxin (DNA-binding transcriptional repressor) of toxin-antitoxin stability system